VTVYFIYLVYALAVARVARLVAEDKILERPRVIVLAKLPEDSLAGYGITCRWCVSIWISIPAAVISYYWGAEPWFFIPALALAYSHITGLLTRVED
jgi:hypothetical protein